MSDFIYDMNLTMGGTFGPEWEFDKIMSSCTYYFKESIHALLSTRVVNYLLVNLLLFPRKHEETTQDPTLSTVFIVRIEDDLFKVKHFSLNFR